MFRAIPVWIFLLCLLFGALFSAGFGWAVKSTLAGSDRSGIFGEAAVAVASFPTLVRSVFSDFRAKKDWEQRVPSNGTDLSEFSDVKQKPGIGVSGLVLRANKSAIERAAGWRILVGVFVIDEEFRNAALALSPELEITKVWLLNSIGVGGKEPPPQYKTLAHGFDVMSDGSVVYSHDGGISLQRMDYCGSVAWAIDGKFHHSVTLSDREESVWTLLDEEVLEIWTETGEIKRRFSLEDVIAANPTHDIFTIRMRDDNGVGGNSRNKPDEWYNDPFHLNDVDPLPEKLADLFDGFAAGDLLLSARSLNLVFVLDPDTLEVKWWRSGAVRRQHDPDWSHTGEITVFDNRMNREYSRIASIAPTSYRTKTLFDGRENDFYSRIRGKHQVTAAGNLIVTSSQQGRFFEIDPNGEVVLEIINRKPGDDNSNYVVSQALWLPADVTKLWDNMSCAD